MRPVPGQFVPRHREEDLAVGEPPAVRPELRELFKEAFTRMTTTVSVVTYLDRAGEPAGFTATSICSLSISPLRLLVCVNRSARSCDEILDRRRLGVNLLSTKQQEIADCCSRPGAAKSLRDEWLRRDAAAETPVLKDAMAHVDCRVVRAYPEGTHAIVVAEIEGVWLGPSLEPLLYRNRRYRDLGSAPEDFWERVAFGSLS